MKKLFLIFDLGQTLINEWNFIEFFDQKLLELVNGFGGRIDSKNYITLRNNIIKNRLIGNGEIEELIITLCRLILPIGYDKIIFKKIKPDLDHGKRKFFCLNDGAKKVVETLSKYHEIGIISNQPEEALEPLMNANILSLFRVLIPSKIKMKKPYWKLPLDVINLTGFPASRCIMIGDRLDIDIFPANQLGMKTIRFMDSLFNLQSAEIKYEIPTYTVKKLEEIPNIIKDIV
ncbi:MAG: HAD family hydrolase [Nitrososphaeraceae archaeon]